MSSHGAEGILPAVFDIAKLRFIYSMTLSKNVHSILKMLQSTISFILCTIFHRFMVFLQCLICHTQ